MRELVVYLNTSRVAVLREQDDLWQLEYEPAWQTDPAGFSLSPHLPRSERLHRDGASVRQVQWYFDNLLPEELLRATLLREAGIKGDDAFALLAYLGAESAGSLTLLPADEPLPQTGSRRQLADAELSERIRSTDPAALNRLGTKRMSLAGTQNKLLVGLADGDLYLPEGAEPSTHLLKPDNTSPEYPCTVANEYFTMSLARALLPEIPVIHRRRVPESIYLIARFDRQITQGQVTRHHAIDACQLLGKPRGGKYVATTLASLNEVINLCTNRAQARIRLWQWLVFNLLVGNNDNHLKNISFLVSHEGIKIAPFYDLLFTAVYDTRLYAGNRATWPDTALTLAVPDGNTYAQVTRERVLAAADRLRIPVTVASRELDRICRNIVPAADKALAQMEREDSALPAEYAATLAGERRLLRAYRSMILPEMLARVSDQRESA